MRGKYSLTPAIREQGDTQQVVHEIFVLEHICHHRDCFESEYAFAYGREDLAICRTQNCKRVVVRFGQLDIGQKTHMFALKKDMRRACVNYQIVGHRWGGCSSKGPGVRAGLSFWVGRAIPKGTIQVVARLSFLG